MARMRPGEVAVSFNDLRQLARDTNRPDVEQLIEKLVAHVEAVASEDSFTRLVRDVFETVGEQRGFITEQREFIKEQRGFIVAQQTVLVAATNAMEAIAAGQEKANELAERRLNAQERQQNHDRSMAAMQQTHDQAIQKTRTEKMLVPTISAIVGVVAGALGAFFSSAS